MASIGEFDPLNTRVPATKIEVTVSCRYEIFFSHSVRLEQKCSQTWKHVMSRMLCAEAQLLLETSK